MSVPRKPTILIADNHTAFATGFAEHLETHDFVVSDIVRTTRSGLMKLSSHTPKLLISEHWPQKDLDAIPLLEKARILKIPSMLYTAGKQEITTIEQARTYRAVGAFQKLPDPDEMTDAIRQVLETGRHTMVDEMAEKEKDRELIPAVIDKLDMTLDLTNRQKEVLYLLSRGLSNEQMSQTMHISIETVKEHVKYMLRALGIHDRTNAAELYTREEEAIKETLGIRPPVFTVPPDQALHLPSVDPGIPDRDSRGSSHLRSDLALRQ